MRIKKIELSAFRRFSGLTLDLENDPKRIIALVGPNGSGKSCIFDAFEETQKTIKSVSRAKNNLYYSKKYYIEGETDDYNSQKNIKIIFDSDNYQLKKNTFYIRTAYRFTSVLDLTQLQKQTDPLNDTTRPASTSDLDTRLAENYERLQGKMFEAFEAGNTTGRQIKEELIGQINKALSNVLDIRISSLGNVINGEGRLYFEKGISKKIPFDNLSSGEKEVIDILIDVVVKAKFYDETIICIDEPELHINTSVQRKLIEELEKLIPEKCQLWIATHSIGFLRSFQTTLKNKCQIFDFSDLNFDIEQVLKPMIPNRKNWERIFKTALEDLTGLISPSQIYYCEGRAQPNGSGEEVGIDAKVFNTIFEQKYPDAVFVSSGGNTELDKYSAIALKVLGKVLIDVDIFLLKDRDISSSKIITTLRQRDDFLAENQRHRMLYRREVENYLYDYEILKKIKPDFEHGVYTNLVSDINEDDVKDLTSKLIGALELGNISKNNFKLMLAKEITEGTQIYSQLEQVIFG